MHRSAIRRILDRLTGLFLSILVPIAAPHAQSTAAGSSIRGRVVHAVSGAAIGIATIDVTNAGTGAAAARGTSAADGTSACRLRVPAGIA